MKITEVEIRACSPGVVGDAVDDAQLRGGTAPEVVVISMKTDEGITGVSFGSGGLDSRWRGGITSSLKTAHVAEAFGMTCELHTALYHPLELANLHTSLAISNTGWFELLYPVEDFSFGLAEPLDIRDGYAYAPTAPGLGAVYDWDAIDDATVELV